MVRAKSKMRCDGCWRQHKELPYQAKGKKYCTEACAAYSNPGSNIESAVTDASSTVDAGEPLVESSEDASKTESAVQNDSNKKPSKNEELTGTTRAQAGRWEEKSGQDESDVIDAQFEITTEDFGGSTTRSGPSDSSMQTLEEGLSAANSICDQSIRSMHKLLNTVAENVHEKRGGQNSYVDPKLVNAACNVAAQMASLMKMKLMHHKQIRKNRRTPNVP